MNTARAWTLAWAIMNGVELNPRLPPSFLDKIVPLGYQNRALLDAMHWAAEEDRALALTAVEKSIACIRKTIFPGILGSHGDSST